MAELERPVRWRGVPNGDMDPHLHEEWLVTNGLGGYASGTIAGLPTRRYHGLLVAALAGPLGRTMMFNDLFEDVRLPDRRFVSLVPSGALREFRLDWGMPVWIYEVDGFVIEKRLIMSHGQNTTLMFYRLVAGEGTLRLGLRPAVHFRHHDAGVGGAPDSYSLLIDSDRFQILSGTDLPPLRLAIHGTRTAFTTGRQLIDVTYRLEESRGYDYRGQLFSPGFFRVDLKAGKSACLVASTESWETMAALSPEDALEAECNRRRLLIAAAHPHAREGTAAELVLAADQFIIAPAGRIEDAARARAAGDEVRTVIAGYHWFTDWGRDTMVSLEGLTLSTGRVMEAGWILRTFSYYIRDGLIPNMFPERESEGRYNTADATLWYFHALQRYFETADDRVTLRLLLPKLLDIIEHHRRGTRFGIAMDPEDGLLRQGEEGLQLTWMDAKVDSWVVTPRRGKAVEINALWYNALCLLAGWVRMERGAAEARQLDELAAQAGESFNRRFWYEEGGYLYDVVDGENGDDPACRPNQVFAISLDYPVLDPSRWEPVMEVVRERLLTPVGLRSLAPGHPDYKPRYYGDLRSRDAAYHQGTVWPWLIGPYIDAYLKLHPDDRAGAHRLLRVLAEQLGTGCVGSIGEIHDAEAPYTPRGCVAQAWSVAEVLRCLVKTA